MAREYTSRDTATYTEILCFYKNMTTHEDNKQLFDSSQYSEIPYFAMYSRDANIVSHSSYLAHLEILDNVNSISANKNDSLSIDVYIYENGKEVNRFYFNSYEQIKEYIRSIKKVLNIHISAERHLK